MRRVFLAPFVITGLLLLPSCSQNPQSAGCKTQQELYKFYVDMIKSQNAKVDIFKDMESVEAEKTLKEIYSTRSEMSATLMVLTIDYPECYSVEQIEEAKNIRYDLEFSG